MAEAPARSSFRPVVVAPTFNNVGTLVGVLERIERVGLAIIVVNDGSTDGTAAALAQWSAAPRGVAVEVVTHERNRGKSAALQSGFARAIHLGYTHAASIDTDGQLDPEDLPKLLTVAEAEPTALVLGARDAATHDGPARSMLGRRLSNLGIRLACGAHLTDSQCGLRVYPLALIEAVACRAQRFAFETEIITRAAWAGCAIRQVAVTSRYFPPEERVSHFRPVVDSLRCLTLHGRLVSRSLLPWPHRRIWTAADEAGAPGGADGVGGAAAAPWWRRWWRWWWQWLDPRQMWREVRRDSVGRWSFAAGLSLGTFIANMPIYGFQTVVSLYLAQRLHLHPLPVVAGSHLSTPPIGPVLVVTAILTGHVVLEGEWPRSMELEGRSGELMGLPGHVLLAWLVGSVFVGLGCMVVTFFGSLAILRWLPMEREEKGEASKG